MASLKEIKIRLASIRNTQKITSAMRMVSSAKLHHTQTIVEHMLEYESKAGYQTNDSFLTIGDKPAYEDASQLATALMELYISAQVDRVELLYHHFKNMAEQILTEKVFLPVSLPEADPESASSNYILEPSAEQLLALLLPKVLHLNIYTTLLDTVTSEHAARMLAMQTANDNANDLIQELTLQYNKNRQQAITNELLDIMGGSGQ